MAESKTISIYWGLGLKFPSKTFHLKEYHLAKLCYLLTFLYPFKLTIITFILLTNIHCASKFKVISMTTEQKQMSHYQNNESHKSNIFKFFSMFLFFREAEREREREGERERERERERRRI